jgi:hypothetical protein
MNPAFEYKATFNGKAGIVERVGKGLLAVRLPAKNEGGTLRITN